MGHVVLIVGEQGTGKSLMLDKLSNLFGVQQTTMDDLKIQVRNLDIDMTPGAVKFVEEVSSLSELDYVIKYSSKFSVLTYTTTNISLDYLDPKYRNVTFIQK